MKKTVALLVLSSLFLVGCIETENMQTNISSKHNFMCDSSSYQSTCPEKGDKIGIIKTNFGVIKFKLFGDDVSETVHNFETLASEGKYNEVVFHRIIKDFMIQGGDFENGNGTGGHSYKGPGTMIDEEFSPKLKHLKGALSMAKTNMPSTTGSQFFIVHAASGTSWLDNKHSVFGQVYYGMEVVDKIANIAVGPNDYPATKVIMEKVLVTEFGGGEDEGLW